LHGKSRDFELRELPPVKARYFPLLTNVTVKALAVLIAFMLLCFSDFMAPQYATGHSEAAFGPINKACLDFASVLGPFSSIIFTFDMDSNLIRDFLALAGELARDWIIARLSL
jgi:hypothetical protein